MKRDVYHPAIHLTCSGAWMYRHPVQLATGALGSQDWASGSSEDSMLAISRCALAQLRRRHRCPMRLRPALPLCARVARSQTAQFAAWRGSRARCSCEASECGDLAHTPRLRQRTSSHICPCASVQLMLPSSGYGSTDVVLDIRRSFAGSMRKATRKTRIS